MCRFLGLGTPLLKPCSFHSQLESCCGSLRTQVGVGRLAVLCTGSLFVKSISTTLFTAEEKNPPYGTSEQRHR